MVIVHNRCPCGGTYEESVVAVRFERDGTVVQLDEVPQGVCDSCGSRVYTAWRLERIESAYKGEDVSRPPNRADEQPG